MVKRGSDTSSQRQSAKLRHLTSFALFTGIIILLNVVASVFFTRIDLTSEKRFTLSETTRDLVRDLEDVVFVRVYLEGDFPPGFKRLQASAREMLDELRISSGGNIEYEFIDPSENPDPKERNKLYQQLASKGIQPTNLREQEQGSESQMIIFPGAIVTYRSNEVPLMLLQDQAGASTEVMLNNSIQSLEYAFANTIRKITSVIPQRILFVEGHGELDENEVADIMRELGSFYLVDRKRIDGKLKALDGYNAIVIAAPDSVFSDKDKFIIDQYIMKGGRALWLVDGAIASMDSLQSSDFTIAMPHDVGISDMLFRYGARINTNLVLDLQSAPIPVVTGYIGNRPQQSLLPWYYFPVVIPDSDHPVVSNLPGIRFRFASSLDTVGAQGILKTPLLWSSKYSRASITPARVDLEIMQKEPDPRQFNDSDLMLAVLLEGVFASSFKNRIVDQIASSQDIGFRESSDTTAMIVISDGSVIQNDVRRANGTIIPLGLDRYTGQVFGNKNFILNCIDYLCDDSGLMAVRSK
jgi:ABC-2 type transport system permease protein